jgi:catalase (peroxidase I)
MNSCSSDAQHFIRAIFHDAATFDQTTGLGGADGSLQFELGRRENLGLEDIVEFSKTLAQQHGASVADVLAYGSVLAVKACAGPVIPFLHGRIDARAPNAENMLPGASISAQENRAIHVNRMGFTVDEMVALIGGGHSAAELELENNPGNPDVRPGKFDSTDSTIDNVFFVELLQNPKNSRIPADRNMLDDPEMADAIRRFAATPDAFRAPFAAAMEKLMNFGAKFSPTGTLTTSPVSPVPY